MKEDSELVAIDMAAAVFIDGVEDIGDESRQLILQTDQAFPLEP